MGRQEIFHVAGRTVNGSTSKKTQSFPKIAVQKMCRKVKWCLLKRTSFPLGGIPQNVQFSKDSCKDSSRLILSLTFLISSRPSPSCWNSASTMLTSPSWHQPQWPDMKGVKCPDQYGSPRIPSSVTGEREGVCLSSYALLLSPMAKGILDIPTN